MRNNGHDLQRLVAAIEQAKAVGRGDMKIESPAYLKDKITGRLREHDVLLTYSPNHHGMIVALECRDRSRPIGVEQVEAFHTKCENTGVHQGIFVSSKGFTKTAVTKASFYGIRCLSLDATDGFDWCATPGILFAARTLTDVKLAIGFPEGVDVTSGRLVDTKGKLVSEEKQRAWVANVLTFNSDKIPPQAAGHQMRLKVENPPFYVQVGNERVRSHTAYLTIDFRDGQKFSPFSFRRYGDAATSTGITEVAVATIPIGKGVMANVVLSTNPDGTISASLVHPKVKKMTPE